MAMQSQNNYIMAKSNKTEEATSDDVLGIEIQETILEAPKQLSVPNLVKPDINKVIEDRRKAIQEGKIIKK